MREVLDHEALAVGWASVTVGGAVEVAGTEPLVAIGGTLALYGALRGVEVLGWSP